MKTRLKIGDIDTSSKEVKLLKETYGLNPDIQLLEAAIINAQGDQAQALELYESIVKEHPNSAQGLLELGKLYFDNEEYSKALVCCLKAAKLDSKNSTAFLYLGHYYKREKNFDKARKCYEKAYGMNPIDDEIACSLSDMYRLLGDHEANLALLESVTDLAGRGSCGWAWLRLGLHYLDVKNYNDAVYTLQCAAQINEDDAITLECLGEAYLERGANTAALKVFSKASEISNDNCYPLCQTAMIKHVSHIFFQLHFFIFKKL